MPFTEEEKRKWHADRKAGRHHDAPPPTLTCAHCGAPADFDQRASPFPLCNACDGD